MLGCARDDAHPIANGANRENTKTISDYLKRNRVTGLSFVSDRERRGAYRRAPRQDSVDLLLPDENRNSIHGYASRNDLNRNTAERGLEWICQRWTGRRA